MKTYLGETLHELNKEKEDGYAEYPACSSCGHAMVFSFAFPYKEYVCLPCNVAVPMFNNCEKVRRSIAYMDAKKRLWRFDLSVIARTIGRATCAVCKDGSCRYCKQAADKNYQFAFWKKNLTSHED